MSKSDDAAARLTLKIAGVFQDIKDKWMKRLDTYFTQLESLVNGEWLDSSDLTGVIGESRMAAREALDGLGCDLSSELIRASNGIISRFESERASLMEEILDLRDTMARSLSGDENSLRRENELLRSALLAVPEFGLLDVIRSEGRSTYDVLSKKTRMTKPKVQRLAKSLSQSGYIHVDKKSKPQSVVFLSAPWRTRQVVEELTEEPAAQALSSVQAQHPAHPST